MTIHKDLQEAVKENYQGTADMLIQILDSVREHCTAEQIDSFEVSVANLKKASEEFVAKDTLSHEDVKLYAENLAPQETGLLAISDIVDAHGKFDEVDASAISALGDAFETYWMLVELSKAINEEMTV